MANEEALREHHASPTTPGPTLERHDPQDGGLHHNDPHTQFPEHYNPQDEGPEAVKGPYVPVEKYVAFDQAEKHERADHICGVKRKFFWIFLIFAMVIVVGAIAGGLGGALAKQKNRNTSPSAIVSSQAPLTVTATATATSTSATGGNEVNTTTIKASDDCRDDTLYQSPVNNFQFLMQCDTSYDLYNEILDIFTVSFALCMDACSASHATETNPNATSCNRVVYQPNVTAGTGGVPNCYLLSRNNTQGLGGPDTGTHTAIASLNGGGAKHKRHRRRFLSFWFEAKAKLGW